MEEKKEERRDILICGATGFTGRKLLFYALEKRKGLLLGILCRREAAAKEILSSFDADVQKSVQIHISEVTNIDHLAGVFHKYKVVINCIGPFIYTGLPIVEAAIRAKTHYIDCTGEPGFMKKSFDMFGTRAEKEGVTIVHACGFDSLPVDIGMVHAMQSASEEETNILQAESYLHLKNCKINIGTFKTIIASLDNRENKKEVEKMEMEKKKEKIKYKSIKKRKVKRFPFYSSKVNMYSIIFPGSDAWVMRKTQEKIGNIPTCHCYIAEPTIFGLISLIFLALLAFIIYMLPKTLRNIAYTGIDTLSFGMVRGAGPTEQEISSSGFEICIILSLQTDNDKKPYTREMIVSGPDPGYITTPAALLVSAETILADIERFSRKGGVYTPGSAFYHTDIVSRLIKENIMFCGKIKK